MSGIFYKKKERTNEFSAKVCTYSVLTLLMLVDEGSNRDTKVVWTRKTMNGQ